MKTVAGKRRRRATDAEVQRLNVHLDVAAYERLMIFSVMSKKTPGLVVEELINANCTDWRVQSNPSGRARKRDRAEAAGDVIPTGPHPA